MTENTAESDQLTQEDHDDLIRAFFGQDDDCAHNSLVEGGVIK